MSEQLLNILKLCLLALIYLFLVRVLRAVWAEVSVTPAEGGRRSRRRNAAPAPAPAAPRSRRSRGSPTELVAVEPAESVGRRYPLGDERTACPAPRCQGAGDDT